MNSMERREAIVKCLSIENKPLKGTYLAKLYGVTRQIIVKDIAILRAKGNDIIATPEGYILGREDSRIKFIIAVKHDASRLEKELTIIIKYGGIVEDVIVEHKLYGEIRGMLMIKNLNDLNKFIEGYNKSNINPLSMLTNGIHIHTISVDTEENMRNIIKELEENKFIIG